MSLIMVADDEPEIVKMLKVILESHGHQVISVFDGVQMVEKAKDWRPHLIIIDIMMPGAYGSSAFKALQEDPVTSSIPAIFLTAVPPDKARRVVTESEKVRLVYKPIKNVQDFLAIIEDLIPKSKDPPAH